MESNRKKTKQKLILVIAVCLSIIVGSFAYWRLTLVHYQGSPIIFGRNIIEWSNI